MNNKTCALLCCVWKIGLSLDDWRIVGQMREDVMGWFDQNFPLKLGPEAPDLQKPSRQLALDVSKQISVFQPHNRQLQRRLHTFQNQNVSNALGNSQAFNTPNESHTCLKLTAQLIQNFPGIVKKGLTQNSRYQASITFPGFYKLFDLRTWY